MKIKTRERGEVTIIEPRGRITIGAGDVALRDAVDEALEAGGRQFLINFKKVSRMDSSGLGELVLAREKVTNSGGVIKLFNLPRGVGDVLEVTQIHTVFDVFQSEEQAVASFH
ncbi:MAG: STAS domain-containing protein [Acidobacteriota bacterium]|nr:STAS domain-containing protein [Acidobacteriota bacterium]